MAMLCRCQNLVDLKFCVLLPTPDLRGIQLPGLTVLPKLKILRIQIDGLTLPPANEPDTITVSFLKFIEAPRLELLSISWRSGSTLRTLDTPTPGDVDFLATFQANSAPPLHELQLVCPHIRVRDWTFSVTSLRALTLRLDDMAPFDDECAALLTDVSDGSPRLLPHLERFYLIGEIHAAGESLLRMVQKRAEAGSGLRVLHLDIRTTSMRKLGKLGSFDLIRQTVPYARIEGLDVLAKYHSHLVMNDPPPSSLTEGLADGHEIRLCGRCENSVQIEPRISLADVESLRTGALLEPTDVAHARELTERRISSVDEDVAYLQRVLLELAEHKRRLLRRVDLQKAYVAPIRGLPTELLSEIFYHCCVEFDDITSKNSCMPLVLGAVCKRWHDIAHDTPRMWTDVRMSKGLYGGKHIRPNALRARLQLYLRNSKGLPFSNAVQFYNDVDSTNPHAVAFPLLLQHPDRWTSVDIRYPGFSKATEGVTFTRLHTVMGNAFGFTFIEPEGRVLEHAPALRRAILQDIAEDRYVPSLPWNRFERMNLSSIAPFAVKILPHCSALVTLELSLMKPRNRDNQAILPGVVHLPSLRNLHLHIAFDREYVPIIFMKLFRTPRLDFLSMKWSTSYGYHRDSESGSAEDGDALAVFYALRPPLREISLSHPHRRACDWAFSITSLQVLRLDLGYNAPFDDDCATLLATADAGVPRLLPHLETLHLEGRLRVTAASLLQMVEARADRGLRNLHLDIRSANMDRLGKPKIFDLIRQAMPAAVIEGVDALVEHIEKRDRHNELELQFFAEMGQDQEWIDEYIRNRDKQAYER
ncbi:hypothetical protein K525DRAFT_265486 [Schizophyllum commune Loenen D]|nr:hypothetical protein K525DRAFT_265486 [Schizophyllum commune Loenen D]